MKHPRPAPINIEACLAHSARDEESISLKSIDIEPSPWTTLADFQLSPIESHHTKERWLYVTAAATIFFLLVLMLTEFTESQEDSVLRPMSDYGLRRPDCDTHERVFSWKLEERDGKILINDKYPGPVMEAIHGDTIQITIRNRLSVSTSLHIFGVPVNNSQDGTPFVTQAPIYPGEIYTVSFVASQVGTFLWGSMTGVQRLDGLAGVLIVHRDCKAHARELVLLVSEHYAKPAGQLLEGYLESSLEHPKATEVLVNGRSLAEVMPAPGLKQYRVVHAGSLAITMVTDTLELIEPGETRTLPATHLRWTLQTGVDRPQLLRAKGQADYTLTLSVESRNGHTRHTVNNISYVPANYALISKATDSAAGLGTPYSPDILTLTHEGNFTLLIINQTPTTQPLAFHGLQVKQDHLWQSQINVLARSSKLIHVGGTQPGLWPVHSLDCWSTASGLMFIVHTT